MPTAARLIAGLGLALLAWAVCDLIVPLFPEGKDFGLFFEINAALGIVIGWILVGPRAGRGLTPAINNGLTGMGVLVFWGLFVQGAIEMTRLAMRHRYDGPFEALVSIFEIGFEFFVIMMTRDIVVTLVIGAVLVGLATEAAARTWR